MKNIKFVLLLFFLFISLLVVGCSPWNDYISNHKCLVLEWTISEEPSCSEEGERYGVCEICFDIVEEKINKTDHTPKSADKVQPSCLKDGMESGVYCGVCNVIIEGCETISALGHNEVIDEATVATETTPGKTEGKHCSRCGEIIVKQVFTYFGQYTNPLNYVGVYAYDYLGTFQNGEDLKKLYEEINKVCEYFHLSSIDAKTKQVSNSDVYYVAEVDYSEYGLTNEQALSVWSAYKIDHPLYYWMSNRIIFDDDSICVVVFDEYACGEIRDEINEEIYETVEKYVNLLDGASDLYQVVLSLHDNIIYSGDYAYEADGITPRDDPWAHNIVGLICNESGVCESYTKLFQLMLNYCKIENVYVTGVAGLNNEPHAWNLVRLDDGNWYWFDLTWDDLADYGNGIRYNYFCINDIQDINWADGDTNTAYGNFLYNHTPAVGGVGINFSYSLPSRSQTEYEGVDEIRDEVIVKDGLSYVINGFKTVALININDDGVVSIPESIIHNGTEYKVVMISNYENGIFLHGSVIDFDDNIKITPDITSINIPKTITFIWDYAFDKCITVKEFYVDKDNSYFTSKDGVLFTKTLYTLIQYPLGNVRTSYIVPSQTVEIAFVAFGDGGNVIYPRNLSSITLGKNVRFVGTGNFGAGFRDSEPYDINDVVIVGDYLSRIKRYSALGIALYVYPGNNFLK